MEKIKRNGKCCLSCQHLLIHRTFQRENGIEILVTEDPDGICSDKKHPNEKRNVLFSCSHYQRWNTIDVEIAKNKNRSQVREDNSSYLSQDINKVESANLSLKAEARKQEEKQALQDEERNETLKRETDKGVPMPMESEATNLGKKKESQGAHTKATLATAISILGIGFIFLLLIPPLISFLGKNWDTIEKIETGVYIALSVLLGIVTMVVFFRNKFQKKE